MFLLYQRGLDGLCKKATMRVRHHMLLDLTAGDCGSRDSSEGAGSEDGGLTTTLAVEPWAERSTSAACRLVARLPVSHGARGIAVAHSRQTSLWYGPQELGKPNVPMSDRRRATRCTRTTSCARACVGPRPGCDWGDVESGPRAARGRVDNMPFANSARAAQNHRRGQEGMQRGFEICVKQWVGKRSIRCMSMSRRAYSVLECRV
jgi:hypothetical protein